jgi:chromosome partitioning protein
LILKIPPHFTVRQVARMAGVESRQIRDFERDGRLPKAPRDGENRRVYTFEEARRIVGLLGEPVRRRIAVVNQKGGVGKTTTAFNLAGALVARGRRVLAVDLDPQANLTTSLGVDLRDGDRSVEELFVSDDPVARDVVRETRFPGLSCLPARPRLAGVEVKIFDAFLRETILDRQLEPLHGEYDFILLDCPPNLSLVTVNALVACEDAIVPIEAQAYSIKAISDLTNTVALIRSRLGRGVTLRFLPTKVDGRVKVAAEILDAVRQGLKDRVLPPVRTDSNLVRAPMMRAPVSFSFPSSKGARDYARLADLLLRPGPGPAPEARVAVEAGPQKTDGTLVDSPVPCSSSCARGAPPRSGTASSA